RSRSSTPSPPAPPRSPGRRRPPPPRGRGRAPGPPAPARPPRERPSPAPLPSRGSCGWTPGLSPAPRETGRGGGSRSPRPPPLALPAPGTALAPILPPAMSGDRDGVDAGRLAGQVAQLVGDRQGVARRRRRELLEIGGRGVLDQDVPPQVVVMDLLRLDGIGVEPRRLLVPHRLAEADELGVADLRDRLAGEGAAGDPLDRRAETAQVLVERRVAVGQRIEVGQVLAQLDQPLADQGVVLHLVPALLGEGELGVHLRGGGPPGPRE